jgi:hypothetical protein
VDFGKKPAAADFIGVFEIGGGRVRILGGTVANDQEGAGGLGRDRHGGNLVRLCQNARAGRGFIAGRIR